MPPDSLEQILARDEARRRKALGRTADMERKAREARASAPAAPDDHEWRPIPGFGDAYEIHRDGRVRSWKAWRGEHTWLPRAMKVQAINGRRSIQLGLHGGSHDVDELVEQIFADGEPDA